MSYKQARGAIPWRPGDDPPEKVISRIRGDHTECEAIIAQLRRMVSLDLAKMATLARGLISALESRQWAQGTSNWHVLMSEAEQALKEAPDMLWQGPAELHNGMLCGYRDPTERIDAPDQIVEVYVTGKKNGGNDDTEDGAERG